MKTSLRMEKPMTEVNPRTLPIAMAIVGGSIIVMAIYAIGFGQRSELLSTVAIIGIFVGVVFVLLAGVLYERERDKYYEDRKEIHL